jgi:DnaK suppressor protein
VARPEKAKADVEVPQEHFQALRERLESQRNEILNMYKQDLRAGQESADDGTEDIVDRANNAYNRELMFSLSDVERNTLLQIENALRRMDEGGYGRCANCGQSIAILRLEALPWARFCVDCQELAEKGLLEVEAS